MNSNICTDANINPTKFGKYIIISGVIYRPYRNQQKLFTNIMRLELKIIDFDERSFITLFITDNGDPDSAIDIIHPTRPIVSPFELKNKYDTISTINELNPKVAALVFFDFLSYLISEYWYAKDAKRPAKIPMKFGYIKSISFLCKPYKYQV